MQAPYSISPIKPLAIAVALAASSQVYAVDCPTSYIVDSLPSNDTEATTTFAEAIDLYSECSASDVTITIDDSLAGQQINPVHETAFVDNSQLTITAESNARPILILPGGATAPLFSVSESATLTLRNIEITRSPGNLVSASAVHGSGSRLELDNVSVVDILSSNAGPVANMSFSELHIQDSVFENNYSETDGGVFHLFDSDLEIIDSTFTDNSSSAKGGAILMIGESGSNTLSVDGSTFRGNSSIGQGGAIYASRQNTMQITDSIFEENSATGESGITIKPAQGGAIFMSAITEVNIARTVFSDNYTYGYTDEGDNIGSQGGALYVSPCCDIDVMIEDVTANRNEAQHSDGLSAQGGFLHTSSAETTHVAIHRSALLENHADGHGGALYSYGAYSHVDVINTTLANNNAAQAGGALYFELSQPEFLTITHNTFIANSAEGNGAGALHYVNGSGVTLPIRHSVFSENSGALGSVCAQENEVTLTAFHSFIDAHTDYASCRTLETEGTNLIGTEAAPLDPQLSTLGLYGGETPSYVPQQDSPLIDAGALPEIGDPDEDQRGETRPVNGLADIGSTERQEDESTNSQGESSSSGGGNTPLSLLALLLGLFGLRQRK